MSLHLYTAFVATCVLLALTPGPSMSLFLAHCAKHGLRAALLTIAGSTLGLGVLAAGVALGMGSIMAHMAEWFGVVRWVGAGYLVWLGARRLRVAFAAGGNADASAVAAPGRWFWQGLGVSLSNPKVLLFLGAFFPQFVEPGAPVAPQLALLAVTFVVVIGAVDTTVALAAGSVRGWIAGQGCRITDGLSGALLVCGGLWLALARR